MFQWHAEKIKLWSWKRGLLYTSKTIQRLRPTLANPFLVIVFGWPIWANPILVNPFLAKSFSCVGWFRCGLVFYVVCFSLVCVVLLCALCCCVRCVVVCVVLIVCAVWLCALCGCVRCVVVCAVICFVYCWWLLLWLFLVVVSCRVLLWFVRVFGGVVVSQIKIIKMWCEERKNPNEFIRIRRNKTT